MSSPSQPGTLTRRQVGLATLAGGLGLTRIPTTSAQSPEATPGASPVPGHFTTVSPTREDVLATLRATYPIQPPGNDGGDVITGYTLDISTLNPLLRSDFESGYVTNLIYESLVNASPIDGSPIPMLADSWDLSEDGVTWRFHLNPNATWQDGKLVTADDVVFSFDAALAEDGFSPIRTAISGMLARYEKLDDHTIDFTATGQLATFLEQTVMQVSIMPKHIWGDVPFSEWPSDGGTTGSDPARIVGSGPFTFVEWVQNDHVTVQRHDAYWLQDQKPSIERWIYRALPNSTAALQSLQTGEIDIVSVSPEQVDTFESRNPEYAVIKTDTAAAWLTLPNLTPDVSPFFQDIGVRKAMMYALDRDLVADTIFNGFAIRADGPQPVLSFAYAPDRITSVYTYDPDQARALLDEAGWTPGTDGIREKDGIRFGFEMLYYPGFATIEQLVPYVQHAWKEVGIEMQVSSMPYTTMAERMTNGDFVMALCDYGYYTDGSQGWFYRCDAEAPEGANVMHYCNPDYDALDDRQQRELDPAKRRDLLIDGSNIIADELPNAPLVFIRNAVTANPRVHNFIPSGFALQWFFPYLWVDA